MLELKLNEPLPLKSEDISTGIIDAVPTFTLIDPHYRRFAGAFAASVGFHGFLIAFLPLLFGFLLSGEPRQRVEATLVRIEHTPLILHLPEDLDLNVQRLAPPKKQSPPKSNAAKDTAEKPGAAAGAPPAAPPPVQIAKGSPEILIQPNSPKEPPPAVKIPSIATWSPQAAPTSKPVTPGVPEPKPAATPAVAEPSLSPPNLEPAVSSVSFSRIEVEPKKFLLTPATTTPVRVVDAPDIPVVDAASLGHRTVGQPLALLSISKDVPKPGDTIVVPPGNRAGQIGSPDGAPKGIPNGAKEGLKEKDPLTESIAVRGNAQNPFQQLASAARPGQATSPGSAVGSAVETASERANGKSSASTTEKSQLAEGNGRGNGNAGASGSSPAPASASDGSASLLRALPPARPDAVPRSSGEARIVSFPSGGNFDVVVLQSGGEAIPDSEGLLSGHLVYTVYLNVGMSREWILQYCLPETEKAEQQGMVVDLGSPPKIDAPYIRAAALPTEPNQRTEQYLIFHGTLGADGKFQRMRQVRGGPAGGKLMPLFDRWEFRPARRDGVPAAVEIILAVPPGSIS
jgi:hypothetical protein